MNNIMRFSVSFNRRWRSEVEMAYDSLGSCRFNTCRLPVAFSKTSRLQRSALNDNMLSLIRKCEPVCVPRRGPIRTHFLEVLQEAIRSAQ
jgi:hypothetical protein